MTTSGCFTLREMTSSKIYLGLGLVFFFQNVFGFRHFWQNLMSPCLCVRCHALGDYQLTVVGHGPCVNTQDHGDTTRNAVRTVKIGLILCQAQAHLPRSLKYPEQSECTHCAWTRRRLDCEYSPGERSRNFPQERCWTPKPSSRTQTAGHERSCVTHSVDRSPTWWWMDPHPARKLVDPPNGTWSIRGSWTLPFTVANPPTKCITGGPPSPGQWADFCSPVPLNGW